jgi:hypothetical protein
MLAVAGLLAALASFLIPAIRRAGGHEPVPGTEGHFELGIVAAGTLAGAKRSSDRWAPPWL